MIEKDKFISPHLPKFPPGYKLLRNKSDGDHRESTDKSCTDKDDFSRTDKDKSIVNLKSVNNKNSDDKYKE